MPVDIQGVANELIHERIESKTENEELRDQLRRVKYEAEQAILAAARSRLAKLELEKRLAAAEEEVQTERHRVGMLEAALREAKAEKEGRQAEWDALAAEVLRDVSAAKEEYEDVTRTGLHRLREAEDLLRARELGVSDPLKLVTVKTAAPSTVTPAVCERCARRAVRRGKASSSSNKQSSQDRLSSKSEDQDLTVKMRPQRDFLTPRRPKRASTSDENRRPEARDTFSPAAVSQSSNTITPAVTPRPTRTQQQQQQQQRPKSYHAEQGGSPTPKPSGRAKRQSAPGEGKRVSPPFSRSGPHVRAMFVGTKEGKWVCYRPRI